MQNVWLNPRFASARSQRAVLADRDGTLIEHVDYLSNPAQVRLLPGVQSAVWRLLDAGIPFFILTNQSGVGRGYFPIEQVQACQTRLFELLEIRPDQLAGWCIAPEAPETKGGYRKPSPRFVHEACTHMEMLPDQCHIIGDTLVDLETAWNAGAHAWAVGCGKTELPKAHAAGKLRQSYNFKQNFADCVREIISQD